VLGVAALVLAGGMAAAVPIASGSRSSRSLVAPGAGAAAAARPAAAGAGAMAATAGALQEKGYPFQDWDGRFTFVRIYFDAGGSGDGGGFGGRRRGFGGGCRGEPCWHHDYPYAETNLTSLVNEITAARAFVGGNVIRAGDPELLRFPLAWMAEPGYWNPDEKEVENLRAYLLKGGFIIFDDFGGYETDHLVEQLQRIVPELKPIVLNGSEPIFHAFFDIAPENLELHSYRAQRGGGARYIGYFEDNDPAKRQLAILNSDNDIGEFIEYNETGFSPVDMTNQAYMLAVNYIMYALTH
jgi:hypothetical protein